MFNYGGRNGISTIIRVTKHICRIYLTFSARITQYISDSTLETEKKTTVLAWLNAAQEACMILEEIQVSYEG